MKQISDNKIVNLQQFTTDHFNPYHKYRRMSLTIGKTETLDTKGTIVNEIKANTSTDYTFAIFIILLILAICKILELTVKIVRYFRTQQKNPVVKNKHITCIQGYTLENCKYFSFS